MVHTFEGISANDVWLKAKDALCKEIGKELQPSRAGLTVEILRTVFNIENPIERWTISRQPALNPAFAIAETFWILGGYRDSKFLDFWNPQLSKYAGECRSYHGAYGFRLRHGLEFDQFSRAFDALKNNPHSRQVVLQIWDSRKDFPKKTGTPKAADIPCNVVAFLKIRKEKLEWTQIVRSNDIVLGVPHDFVVFTTLQEIMAGWLDVELGSYSHFSDSLHVYQHDISKLLGASYDMNFDFKNSDSLALPKKRFDEVLLDFCDRIRELGSAYLTRKRFLQISNWNIEVEGYMNLLRVLSAESARRRQWLDLLDDVKSDISNLGLKSLWAQWENRTLAKSRKNKIKIKTKSGKVRQSRTLSNLFPTSVMCSASSIAAPSKHKLVRF